MLDVRQCITKEDYDWIINKMEHGLGIREVFKDNTDRLKSSSIAAIITCDELPIGFIYVAHELSDERIGFVDMGIVSDKRGYGYGEQAMDIFLDKTKNIDMFLIAETKENNGITKRSLSKYDCIYKKEDLNFYLLNRSLEELRETGLYEQLIDHLNSKRLSSKDLIKSLY